MSVRSLLTVALAAALAMFASPDESRAQYGGCNTCGTVSTYRPMVVRYGLFGRPRAVFYGAPVATVTPTVAFSPVSAGCTTCPTTAFYPSACASCVSCAPSACSTCAPSACSTCSVGYRPTIVSTPVTTFRPVSGCNSCGGVTTYMRPVTTFVQQVQYTPETTCAPTVTAYAPSCGPDCTGCSVCAGSNYAGSCGPNCPGCSQCAVNGGNSYPQTQPGNGYNSSTTQPSLPQTYQEQRPQTYPDTQHSHTNGNEPQTPRPIPNTSGASVPGNGGNGGSQPQLIDPDSRTTQAPQRTWTFRPAVATQDDLTSRIIPVEHQQPAPRVQNQAPVDDGWRTTRSR